MPDNQRDLSYLATPAEFAMLTACPWCSSEDLSHLATRGDGLEVRRCDSCGLGFLAELPDDLSVFYDAAYFTRDTDGAGDGAVSGYERYDDAVTASNFRWLAMLTRCAAGESARTLFDMGTATGTFLEIARLQGFDVRGSELVPEGAAVAQAKGLDVTAGPFDPADWPAKSFDVVAALEVLEHVRDIRATLTELGSLVADDGLLVFFVPNVPKRLIERYGDTSIDFNKSFEHTFYFDPSSLRTICDEVFGPGSLTLLEADGREGDQMVSFALGFVRMQPLEDRPEQRLVAEVNGSNLDLIPTAYEAQAIALTAAKFGQFDRADRALSRAKELAPDAPDVALTMAQILRNRGKLFAALEGFDDSVAMQTPETAGVAGPLFREIIVDFVAVANPDAAALPDALREVHRRLDLLPSVQEALASSDAQLAATRSEVTALNGRVAEAESRGRQLELAERLLEAERGRAAHLERSLAIAQHAARAAEVRADEADAAAGRTQALADQLEQSLNDIYDSRAWKSITGLRGAKQRIGRVASRSRAVEEIDDEILPDDELRSGRVRPSDYPVSVSVVMPVYNKGATLRDSLDSVFGQTFQDFEVVVWDDGSTDPLTLEVLDEVSTLDGVTVVHAANQGVIGARNSAMRLARGEFIVCLDPDDRFGPTYLEKAVLFLRSQPEVSIVYPWQQTVGSKHELWETQDLDPMQIAHSNHVPVCAVFHRDVFAETGGFSTAMDGGVEDWEYWTHAAELGFVGRVIPEALFEYTYSDDPAASRDAAARNQLGDLQDRIRTLHPLVEMPSARREARDIGISHIDLDPPIIPEGEGRPIVLFLPWVTVGGADRVVKDLTTHWTTQGRTVIAITTLGVVSGMEDRVNDLLALTPYVYQLPSFLPGHLWYPFVDRLLDGLPAANVLNIGSTWFHDHAAKLKRAHPDLRIVDQQFNDAGHLDGNQLARPAVDLTVTAYKGLRKSFLEDGRPAKSVVSVYVGIEPAEVGDDAVSAARDEIGLQADEPYVAFVGRLSEEKRPEWLFPLADALEERGIRVAVVGTGPLAEKLGDDLVDHPGIVWAQHVEDTAPVFAGARATVLPSKIEGIPLTAMESLAVGTPVVATDVGGLPELADVAGVHLVKANDRLGFIKATVDVVEASTGDDISLPDELTLHGMIARYDDLIDPA